MPADSPTPYEEYVLSEDYGFRASTLQYDQATGEFSFHITTRTLDGDGDEQDKSKDSVDSEHQTVLGIDLGVNSLAVASTGTFWSGDEYDHWCREFEKRRTEMQQCGIQAAHNALLRLGRRERAWRKQSIHTVATEIVTEAVEHECDVIVFEDLTDIRERLPHAEWNHVWAFRRLVEYVEYKAAERGVALKQVNADYNGAKNVGLRYMRNRQHRLRSSPTSRSVDAPVDVRVNGGMLTGNGYRPTVES